MRPFVHVFSGINGWWLGRVGTRKNYPVAQRATLAPAAPTGVVEERRTEVRLPRSSHPLEVSAVGFSSEVGIAPGAFVYAFSVNAIVQVFSG
jgi:hypothetical protein